MNFVFKALGWHSKFAFPLRFEFRRGTRSFLKGARFRFTIKAIPYTSNFVYTQTPDRPLHGATTRNSCHSKFPGRDKHKLFIMVIVFLVCTSGIRKETWTMDRRTRAVMFAKQIVHSPQLINSIGQLYTTAFGHLLKNNTVNPNISCP